MTDQFNVCFAIVQISVSPNGSSANEMLLLHYKQGQSAIYLFLKFILSYISNITQIILIKSIDHESFYSSSLFVHIIHVLYMHLLCFQAPWEIPEYKPDDSWPSQGNVSLQDYSTRYRPGLDLILKDLTLHVAPMEKVLKTFIIICNI